MLPSSWAWTLLGSALMPSVIYIRRGRDAKNHKANQATR